MVNRQNREWGAYDLRVLGCKNAGAQLNIMVVEGKGTV